MCIYIALKLVLISFKANKNINMVSYANINNPIYTMHLNSLINLVD